MPCIMSGIGGLLTSSKRVSAPQAYLIGTAMSPKQNPPGTREVS